MTMTPTSNPPIGRGLIHTVAGAEAPVAGNWTVGTGQPVTLTGRSLRRRRLTGRVGSGNLVVADDVVGSALEITVQTQEGATRDPPTSIMISLVVTRFVYADRWRAEGTATTSAGSQPVVVELWYRGVFRRGRQASMWLTLDGGLELGRRRFHLAADLNLNPKTPS